MGNNGPDPLFYLAEYPLLHRYTKYASILHKQKTPELLLSMRDAIEQEAIVLKDIFNEITERIEARGTSIFSIKKSLR